MKNKDIAKQLANWLAPSRPEPITCEGQYARLLPLSAPEHSAPLFAANSVDDSIWEFMAHGPFASHGDYFNWLQSVQNRPDPLYLAVFDKDRGAWGGVASFMRIQPEMGVIEVGSITFAPALQRTRAATEAMYLMMKWAFEAGYRRYEWKCNALNLPSCRAAQRLGFSFEGIFRQAMIVKGRNRDTAWFACIDTEWPALKRAFETWLDADNFSADGQQEKSLRSLTAPILVKRDPRLD